MNDGELLNTIEEQRAAVLQLAQQASFRLLIMSHQLEPEYYDTPQFVEACRQMVVRHHRCHVRVLVKNTENLRRQEHRLLPLIQRLPGRMEIKVTGSDDSDYPETFMLADDGGLFLKRTPGRSRAILFKQAGRINAEYGRVFQKFWDRADSDPGLSRLTV